jgi:hypothetical protein
MGGAVGPDLTHVGSRLSRGQLAAVIAKGRGQMPAFDALSLNDLNGLLDYLQSLK